MDKPIEISSDHCSLKYLNDLKHQTNPRLLRWSLKLSPYNYTVVHKSGVSIPHVDCLSRREYTEDARQKQTEITADIESDDNITISTDALPGPPTETPTSTVTGRGRDLSQRTTIYITYDHDAHVNAVNDINQPTVDNPTDETGLQNVSHLFNTSIDIAAEQHKSKDLSALIDFLKDEKLPENDSEAKKLLYQAKDFGLIDGILYRFFTPRHKGLDKLVNPVVQLCVPEQYRPDVFRCLHDNLSHTGVTKLFQLVKSKYYWPNYFCDTVSWIKTCKRCQHAKRLSHERRPPMQSLDIAEPFQEWTIDHVTNLPVGRLPNSFAAYTNILTCVDSYSLWPVAVPTVGTGADEVADFLVNNIITTYGYFRVLHCDRAPAFTGTLISELAKLTGVKKVHSTAYQPRSQNRAERFHSELHKSLRLQLSADKSTDITSWPKLLPFVLFFIPSQSCHKHWIFTFLCTVWF